MGDRCHDNVWRFNERDLAKVKALDDAGMLGKLKAEILYKTELRDMTRDALYGCLDADEGAFLDDVHIALQIIDEMYGKLQVGEDVGLSQIMEEHRSYFD